MKTRRFDFNWKPLQLQISFSVDGSVPDRQSYNADTQEYTPDYTLTPLIIQPVVSVIDKDEVIGAGRINHALANIRWYENTNGTQKLIETGNSDYEITTGGGSAGRIKVRRNAEPKVPITLVFYAEYADSRTGQVVIIQGSYLISCGSASGQVRVELDAAGQTVFNPLSDPREQTVRATVWVGDKKCDSGKYALVWEVLDGGCTAVVQCGRIYRPGRVRLRKPLGGSARKARSSSGVAKKGGVSAAAPSSESPAFVCPVQTFMEFAVDWAWRIIYILIVIPPCRPRGSAEALRS